MKAKPFNPWNNPDPVAVSKVLHPIPAPHSCPYCKAPVELTNNVAIYGRSYGTWPYAYCCSNNSCGAYVGLHPGTNIALGTLADRTLREARSSLKGEFNRIWMDWHKFRTDAYWWLARKLEIPFKECHIAMLDIEQCRKAQKICAEFLTNQRRKERQKEVTNEPVPDRRAAKRSGKTQD